MRIVNHDGRLGLATPDRWVDVETASAGRFSADVQAIFPRWEEFVSWAKTVDPSTGAEIDPGSLEAPVPRPPQVFAVGLNYRAHAAESGLDLPDAPFVFTKFPASVTGPYSHIELPSSSVDFEGELVAVIGSEARNVSAADAWGHIAGLTAGQDLSDRELQLSGPAPQQFSLGKSRAGFTPIGPALVTVDEFDDPDDLELSCTLTGEEMQKTRTGDMIFPIPQIVEYLSAILPLLPGDLIFTGTPSGIGWARDPQRFLGPDDELITRVERIGEMRHHFTSNFQN
ncbi:MAG: fumarylacetoacetate hydrolase family protein [Rhodococcus sp. (in: high G+C Gram-positive bacteria)]|uniref:fumarylacetoacetate hydrolase family protein n=1 Tax=Rhodococcus sp. TaxID=1831 RepID=UPI003BAF6DD3